MVFGNSYTRHMRHHGHDVSGALHDDPGAMYPVLVVFKGGCTFIEGSRIMESRKHQPTECA